MAETVHSWRGCFRPVLLVEMAKNDALVEKLWSSPVLGSAVWSGLAGHWSTEGKVGAVCAQTYFLCLWSFTCNGAGWRWDRVIKSSLMQRSPSDGRAHASCLKQLIALPIARMGAVTL